jgi:hypothetical protein
MKSKKMTPRNEREEQVLGNAMNRLLNKLIADEKKAEQKKQDKPKG